jgi:membrane protein YdbS with pleckstrin-like domain
MEVPVFTVEDDGTAPVDEYARYEFERDDDTPLSKGITLRHPSSHELEIVFGSARRPWFAVLLAAFGLPLTVVAYWMLTSFVLFGAFVVGLMAVLIDWIVLHALLHRSWVTVDQDNVCVRSSMFGEGTPTCIPCTALQKVEAKSSGPRLYSLVVHYRTEAGDDDTLQAASLLPDLVEAEWLASRIEQQAAENARYA